MARLHCWLPLPPALDKSMVDLQQLVVESTAMVNERLKTSVSCNSNARTYLRN